MKYQQVNVDYWAMGKAMLTYAFMAGMVWIMLRMFNMVFLLPRRMRSQQENMQNTLEELQRRYPGLGITEDDLKNAEKELEEYIKEHDEKEKESQQLEENKEKKTEDEESEENKKNI